jgi:hypothetical protein
MTQIIIRPVSEHKTQTVVQRSTVYSAGPTHHIAGVVESYDRRIEERSWQLGELEAAHLYIDFPWRVRSAFQKAAPEPSVSRAAEWLPFSIPPAARIGG